LLLVLALVPIKGINVGLMRMRIWEQVAPNGTPEIEEIMRFQSLQT